MKRTTQKNDIGTREMLNIKNVQNQKFQHEDTYLRVKKEIQDLQLELSDDDFDFSVIERTKIRTVLRIVYFLPDHQIVEKQRQPRKNWSIHNSMNAQSNIIARFQEKEDIEKRGTNSTEELDNQRFVVFTCIIQYDIYPFSPPYIFMTADKNGFTNIFGQNDFRNIIGDLFEGIDWFPIYGLFDIFIKIPYLISKLNNNEAMVKSTYYHPNPFKRSDIELYALGLKLFDGQFYNSKDALIGKYLNKVIGVSFQHLVIFSLQEFNKLTIYRTFKLNQIQMVKIEQNQKRIKFILKLSNKQEICYKFIKNPRPDNQKQVISLQQKENRDEFINWMRICLLNCQLSKKINKNNNTQESFKNKSQKKIVFRDNKIQNIQKLANQSTFYGNKNEDSFKKQPSVEHQNLIQKQESTSLILETLDLLLALPKYQKYQKPYLQDEDIEQVFYGKFGQKKGKITKKQKSKGSLELGIDLTKLEYEKLKEYNKFIESERKRIFRLI